MAISRIDFKNAVNIATSHIDWIKTNYDILELSINLWQDDIWLENFTEDRYGLDTYIFTYSDIHFFAVCDVIDILLFKHKRLSSNKESIICGIIILQTFNPGFVLDLATYDNIDIILTEANVIFDKIIAIRERYFSSNWKFPFLTILYGFYLERLTNVIENKDKVYNSYSSFFSDILKNAGIEKFRHHILEMCEDQLASLISLRSGVFKTEIMDNQDNIQPNIATKDTNALQSLDTLIGLASVKEEIRNIHHLLTVQEMRKQKGLNVPNVSYHTVFLGNPGTGKTTVARLFAQIFKEIGILKKGHLIETDRSGLVAEYVGQTAVKTNNIIDSALDGVLFIDEAYSLVQGGDNDFGLEAISTLLKRMEDDRDRLVVILAGYSDEMKKFIDANPGLQSRFNRYIYFADYSVEELYSIFESLLGKYDYLITPDGAVKLYDCIEAAVNSKDKTFGNARYVRNLFEKTLERQACRIADSINFINDEELNIMSPL